MQTKFVSIAAIAATAVLGFSATAAQADTLADIKAKGYLQCGVTEGTVGFSAPDANNNWSGIDVEYCRAIGAGHLPPIWDSRASNPENGPVGPPRG